MKDTVANFVQGVSFAKLEGFDDSGLPLVCQEGLGVCLARSLVALDPTMIGREIAVAPVASDPDMLLILGLLDPPKPARTVIEAEEELVLRSGKSSVTLSADGRVTIKGKQLLSRAEGQNRVQGAAVMLN